MPNILLVEPSYKTKFPPIGLLRLSSYHKDNGDCVSFTRGCLPAYRDLYWDRIYVSSLFTYELPRTVKTVQYYQHAVSNPDTDIVVGGIAATLMPDYIKDRCRCRVVVGPLNRQGLIDQHIPDISNYRIDYRIADDKQWNYRPNDCYYLRATTGCIRKCSFCAVPVIEPYFGLSRPIKDQIDEVNNEFGNKKDAVFMDNNILAVNELPDIISQLVDAGFSTKATYNGSLRSVDFNQGLDARLVTPRIASLLGKICLRPARFAYDNESVTDKYIDAISMCVDQGITNYTNYVMFNFQDDIYSLYRRLERNIILSASKGIRVTGFPMKYAPIYDVERHYIDAKWHWKYIRGIQCILNATHGMVSPNPSFFYRAFGNTENAFEEIVCMPEGYIMSRVKRTDDGAIDDWLQCFRKLSRDDKNLYLHALSELHDVKGDRSVMLDYPQFGELWVHYGTDTNVTI